MFGQRARPLPFFSMWKEERFLYVHHFQKPRSLFMKPTASTSPSETASGLLINYNPPPAVICSMCLGYSMFTLILPTSAGKTTDSVT